MAKKNCFIFVLLSVLSCYSVVDHVAGYFYTSTLTRPLDLTWTFENNTIYWVGVRPFSFTQMLGFFTDMNYWVALNEFCAGEHGGTHIDAPYHFNKNGAKVGQIPIEDLIVPGAVIDLSDEVSLYGPNTTLQVHHLQQWEQINGPFEYRSLLMIRFGYSKYYPDKKLFLGSDSGRSEDLQFPGISAAAAQWIADSNKFVGVGVDTASVDPGIVKTSDTHRILCGRGLYLIEAAKLLEELPPRGFTFLALPMNIAEGTGAPLRLVALPHGYA